MELSYKSVDDLIRDVPEADTYRNWLRDCQFFQGDGPHGGIVGTFLWGKVSYRRDGIFVTVGDCDDGFITKRVPNDEEAERELLMLHLLAPFTMWDLVDLFDYRWPEE